MGVNVSIAVAIFWVIVLMDRTFQPKPLDPDWQVSSIRTRFYGTFLLVCLTAALALIAPDLHQGVSFAIWTIIWATLSGLIARAIATLFDDPGWLDELVIGLITMSLTAALFVWGPASKWLCYLAIAMIVGASINSFLWPEGDAIFKNNFLRRTAIALVFVAVWMTGLFFLGRQAIALLEKQMKPSTQTTQTISNHPMAEIRYDEADETRFITDFIAKQRSKAIAIRTPNPEPTVEAPRVAFGPPVLPAPPIPK